MAAKVTLNAFETAEKQVNTGLKNLTNGKQGIQKGLLSVTAALATDFTAERKLWALGLFNTILNGIDTTAERKSLIIWAEVAGFVIDPVAKDFAKVNGTAESLKLAQPALAAILWHRAKPNKAKAEIKYNLGEQLTKLNDRATKLQEAKRLKPEKYQDVALGDVRKLKVLHMLATMSYEDMMAELIDLPAGDDDLDQMLADDLG